MTKKAKKENLGFFRENIEALTVAIVMALTVKMFAIEAYKVPTESMEPTIVGRRSGGDRLIVNKFVYQLRDPRRWEIVVFQYPHNTLINYVKRAVGMPDEWVFIRNGDIYTASGSLSREEALAKAEIQRKPDFVQRSLFARNLQIPPADRGVAAFDRYWTPVTGERGVGEVAALDDEDRVVFRAESGLTLVDFQRPETQRRREGRDGVAVLEPVINNRRFDDWSPFAEAPGFLGGLFGAPTEAVGRGPIPGYADEVGDMRVSCEVRPEAEKGEVVLEIRDGTHGIPIRVHLAVEGSGRRSRLVFGEEEFAFDASIEAEEFTPVALANWDDTIAVEVDGDEVFRHRYTHAFVEPAQILVGGGETVAPQSLTEWPPLQPTHDLPHDNGASLGFDGGRASFRELAVARDNYYTITGPTDFRVPADHYLMLGDNSPDSLDARGWKVTEIVYRDPDEGEITLRGDAEGVSAEETRPGGQPFRVEGDVAVAMPPLEGPTSGEALFIDHFGNTRTLDLSRVVSQRTVYGHFVGRELVLGRAYLTFWPLLQWGAIR
ncbi:MAG: signal peptidase I [Planctomycetota bacterium]